LHKSIAVECGDYTCVYHTVLSQSAWESTLSDAALQSTALKHVYWQAKLAHHISHCSMHCCHVALKQSISTLQTAAAAIVMVTRSMSQCIRHGQSAYYGKATVPARKCIISQKYTINTHKDDDNTGCDMHLEVIIFVSTSVLTECSFAEAMWLFETQQT
jgi:hypothetical protein